jgi:hypothetical protein
MSFPFRRLLLASLLVALASPGGAVADGIHPQPTGISAVAQYSESLPSSAGNVAVTPSGRVKGAPARSLSPQVSKALSQHGAQDANALRQLVTNPAFGAPAKRPPRHPLTVRQQRALDKLAQAARPDLTAMGSARVAGIVAALVLVTAGIAAAGGFRRRAGSRITVG